MACVPMTACSLLSVIPSQFLFEPSYSIKQILPVKLPFVVARGAAAFQPPERRLRVRKSRSVVAEAVLLYLREALQVVQRVAVRLDGALVMIAFLNS